MPLIAPPKLRWIIPLALAAALPGCHRAHCRTQSAYRQAADKEAGQIVAGTPYEPRWSLPDFTIQTDPRSRYHDVERPDCPPMPQDDPASHRYMHWVDNKKGFPHWHRDGDRGSLENPDWQPLLGQYMQLTPEGAVKLRLDDAVRLATIHSPDYRQQIESLYLSALDVSTERFRFDVQFFGNNETAFLHSGRERLPGGERNTLSTTTNAELHRKFTTGAELLVGFANSFVWQFAGPDTNATASILNFNLVQPLLRFGGRDRVMEQLTIVERTLLANLRSFQRYRQGFYTNVAVGDGNAGTVQRRGGFIGGTGLTGFTGTGAGGFGEVGGATNFGRAGFGAGAGQAGASGAGFAGGGAGTVGGFVGLLQQLQQVRNTQDNLDAQTRTLGLLEANLQAGLIDIAQVDQFRQNIETEQANLLQARNNLANALDNFKVGNMGLPPDLELALDDGLIRQFQFIDPHTTTTQTQLEDFVSRLGDLPQQPPAASLTAAIGDLEKLIAELSARLDDVRTDLNKLAQVTPERRATMPAEEATRFDADIKTLADNLAELAARFADTPQRLDSLRKLLNDGQRAKATDELVALAGSLVDLTQELGLVQARARLESVTLNRVSLRPEKALAIARTYRLDWMNNRAALVDTWRLIAFNANALESDLDITFSGDLSTQGDNPVKFQSPTGSLRAGVRIDAPFTRLLERNNYRQVLIDYQRDRRRLILFEDTTHLTLRRLLRQLDQLGTNLEIQRRAVVIAVRRVDQTREVLNQPPQAVAAGEAPAALGPTAAQNLLTALSDLRNTQNNFMSVWLNYYATRMLLARELGVMDLDESGVWIERPLDDSIAVDVDIWCLPPAVPAPLLKALDVPEGENGAAEPRPGPYPATRPDVEPHGPVEVVPAPSAEPGPPSRLLPGERGRGQGALPSVQRTGAIEPLPPVRPTLQQTVEPTRAGRAAAKAAALNGRASGQ